MKFFVIIISISSLLLSTQASLFSPHVALKHQSPHIFVKQNETFLLDLDQIFEGHNLTYSTNSTDASVNSSPKLLAKGKFGLLLAGPETLIFQSFPRNTAGHFDYTKYLLLLTMDNFLYWANIHNSTSIPKIVYGIQITNLKSVHCYSSEQISNDLAVVDCAFINPFTALQFDLFYFISFSRRAVVGFYNNTATTHTTFDRTRGNSTRGVKIAEFGNNNRFIFRYVGTDAITSDLYRNDSFIEVYKAANWISPSPSFIISRASLHVPSLNLVDFEVLNGTLFVLDSKGKLFSIQNYENSFDYDSINVFEIPSKSEVLGFALSIEYYRKVPTITAIIYANNIIWEIDLTSLTAPKIIKTITFETGTAIQRVDFTDEYLLVQKDCRSSVDRQLIIHNRKYNNSAQVYQSLPFKSNCTTVQWFVDRVFGHIILWDQDFSVVYNYQIQKNRLSFQSSKVGNGSLLISAISFGVDGSNITLSKLLSYQVIAENDFSLYKNPPAASEGLNYYVPFALELDSLVHGPGPEFAVQNTSTLPKYMIRNHGKLEVLLPSSFKPASIQFHKICSNLSTPGTINWLIQDKNLILYHLRCTESVDVKTESPSISCNLLGQTTLQSQVLQAFLAPQFLLSLLRTVQILCFF